MTQTVVVTGASSGIGAATVAAFKGSGSMVIGVDLMPTSGADVHLQLDLSDPNCGDRLREFCSGMEIDGLVNNAARGLDKAAVDTRVDEFDALIAVNLRAPLLLAAAIHETLASRYGFVVNVASVHAVATSKLVAAYAASKGGLVAMTRALAVEWAPEVRVNVVLPGAVDTRLLRDGLFRTRSTVEDLGVRHPLGRVGSAEEISDAILFLANNRFTTGTTLTIDGGATSQLSTE